MALFSIQKIVFMKLDCEGCEWKVALDWLEHGLWDRIENVVGELHSLCSLEEDNVTWCIPRDMPIVHAQRVWMYLCKVRAFPLEWGCEEPKFAQLGEDVSMAIADKICHKTRLVKKWQCRNTLNLCERTGRDVPKVKGK
ncbi:unnamed protein product [Polarella glacialis]|uniref:Methyltransferase FkbM domain-containing protein n=1 Tax=Polarella glacialis TaxID=89957 RepID=A0A813JPA0_POLGL|nr:unnamed protein product [Polarella glacialis]|mmetsp:Transcript_17904/g.28668  ORF Transcript_17904/g.28668 Transcript_17904/m.28668 type:complete len:139 (+) Transcript_17904:137-553(+)